MLKKSILSTLKKRWALCIALVVVVVGVILASLAPAYILRGIVDNALALDNPISDSGRKLLYYALGYLAALIFIGIFEFLKQALLIVIGENITKDIRATLAAKLSAIDALYLSQTDSGQLTSIFINDVDTVNTIFTDGLIGMVVDLLKIVGIVVSMFIFSYILGLITLAIIPIIYIISHIFKTRMFGSQVKNRVLIGASNNHIGETLRTKQIIKIFSLEKYMTKRYAKLLDNSYIALESVNFYDSIYSPIIKCFTALVIATVIVLSGINLNFIGISIGMLASAVTLIESLFAPVEDLGQELQNLQSALSGIKRVDELLSQKDEPQKTVTSLEAVIPSGRAEIAFNHLSFGYNAATMVLNDLTVKIESGRKVTFVGRTGVGKTTLFKLITGEIKGEGAVTINGIDVFSVANELKPHIFGYVAQTFSFISGSIKNNITLGASGVADSAVLKALDFALLGDIIKKLPSGIDTEFSPALFSQGQLQLLCIARAVLYDPPILLLDEITANLDMETEAQILAILQKASENRTILAISHRESSIIKSDAIIHLQNGKIV